MAISSELRIKTKTDFDTVYKEGKKFKFEFISVFFLKKDEYRLGVVVSKKVAGSAVERNRIRRIVQSFFQKNILDSTSTLKGDIVVVVHSAAEALSGIENNLIEWQKKYLSI